MADTTTTSTTPATASAASRSAVQNGSGTAGKTTIDDTVVSKVAGIAAREVNGVHSLGGGAARAIGAIRDAIGQRDHGQGVKVEVGEKQVAADVVIVAEYPVSLQQVADGVRSSVARALEQIVGMEVAEVNVTVQDVFIPGMTTTATTRRSPALSNTLVGALIGAILAVVALQFGFWGFVLVVVFGLIGALVAAITTGKIDRGALTDVLTGRRSSR